jgi:hypothetical protein
MLFRESGSVAGGRYRAIILVTVGCLFACVLTSIVSAAPFNATMQEKLPASEYSALVDFYNSTNGNGWRYNTNWLNGNETYWDGVFVVGVQYDLHGNLIS